MFDHRHYVPILRWKEGEMTALEKLFPSEKTTMTPLLESVMPKAPVVQASELAKRWGQNHIFIDQSQTVSANQLGGAYPANVFFDQCNKFGLNVIPTLRLKCARLYKGSVKEAIRRNNLGTCIRLSREDIYREDLSVEIESLVSYLEATPKSVDLVIDLGIFNQHACNIANIVSRLPLLAEWRTLTLASGAFPTDLSHLEVGVRFVPRFEWNSWLSQLSPSLPRKPTYGDYTSLHPVLKVFEGMTPSCSIKYATTTDWLIMRGRARKGGHSSEQYYGEAKYLIESEQWCGQFFSYGDSYIYETAQRKKGPGNPTNWLTVGANHHMTFVAHQIAEQFNR